MEQNRQMPSTLENIILHLQEISFASFISWKDNKCIVHNTELFQEIVLPTLIPSCTMEKFFGVLRKYRLPFKCTYKRYKIVFPDEISILNHKSRFGKYQNILEEIKPIDKNKKILESAIASLQAKLFNVTRINSRINYELQKSKDKQLSLCILCRNL